MQQFIDEVVAEHGFDRERVEGWLNAARYSATVERLMQPPIPFGQRNWLEYRSRYLEDKRVQAGVDFWRSNAVALERATERYGVPPEIIVAIIGVETYWGRITGNFRTIDVLATLSFDYLRRSDYYRKELVELLLLAREQRTDPLRFKGSFAGAIGLPQFMPGSIRRFAVDFDGDGRIDLAGSATDAIGSVARFLVQHGWQRDLPILFEAEADEAIVDSLGRGIDAAATWSDALNAGVVADLPLPLDTPVLVIDLPYVDAGGEPESALSGRHRELHVPSCNTTAATSTRRRSWNWPRRSGAKSGVPERHSASGWRAGCASTNAGSSMQWSKIRMTVGT